MYLEGRKVGSINCARGEFASPSYEVTVTDGRLEVRLDGTVGADPYAVLNALVVEPASTSAPAAPGALVARTLGTSQVRLTWSGDALWPVGTLGVTITASSGATATGTILIEST